MVPATFPLLTNAVEQPHAESMSWDSRSFRAWVEAVYAGESLVVLANRDPALGGDSSCGDGGRCGSSSGLIAALEPLMDNCGLLWIARDTRTAPQYTVSRGDEPHASPANRRIRIRRVPPTVEETQEHSDGFCNEGLWPLCHRTSVRPTFRACDFRMYSLANARWVATLCEEIATGSPIVLVQNYNFALAPRMIRERLPQATTAAFWHIPFPSPGVLSACPWERQLVEGLLGSSIVGFQTPDDCRNFLDAAVCVLGADVDRDANVVSYGGHRTLVRAYPASIEWPNRWVGELPSVDACRAIVRRRFGIAPETQLIVGVDRSDYTKGLPQKFFALERLLMMRPEFRGKAVLLQVAEPSRSGLSTYSDYRAHVRQMAGRINQRFATNNYQPIVLVDCHLDKKEVFELFRASDVCYVGSLHDGMNLVSKEFVSARDDETGVLVLSEFAGAARELIDALSINPYSSEDCASTLAESLTMPIGKQRTRMRSMRAVVGHSNAYHWAASVLRDAAEHAGIGARSAFGRRTA
jgi:trehalose 6-phosphate synthase